jgi:spermidine dehydrogenase
VYDHAVSDDRPRITRRDFLDGLAITAAALALPSCRHRNADPPIPFAPERDPAYYPPATTGLRGSHPGSFEIAHQLRDGSLQLGAPGDTGEHYDLVVVGGGISGLAAAHFYRKAHRDARVLVLDNHDDVGGHAKRNELTAGDRTMVSNGGTAAIEFPAQYSPVAASLLAELGVDLPEIPRRYAPPEQLKLGSATFFDKETFGSDKLVRDDDAPSDATLAAMPVSDDVRHDLARLHREAADYWPGMSQADKKHRLAKMSYKSFLIDVAKLTPGAVPHFQNRTHDRYGVGIDAVPALDCWGLGYPGFGGLKLDKTPTSELGLTPALEMHDGPSWFHFPDGNATIARLLVRSLLPFALPGSTVDDAVTARLDYAHLDDDGSATRIRLNSTVVRATNTKDGVDIIYVRGGAPHRVRADACVLACWHTVIPYIVPDLPAEQKKALSYGVKVPIVYTNVALRNWRAFDKLGVSELQFPGGFFAWALLELTGPRASYLPDDPAVVKLLRTPCRPGLPARDQHRHGRIELMATPFEVFETNVRDLLGRALGAAGFDAARDITAITVNRWAHGYTYEYNSLWDDMWPAGQRPCDVGRRRFGRITIANADSGAYAYTDCAIDQAWRAVGELSE